MGVACRKGRRGLMRCGRGLDLIEMDRGNGRDYGKGAWLGYKGAGSAGKEAWLEDQ